MKNIIYLLVMLSLAVTSCVDDSSVRVMSEFNCKDTKIDLTKEVGSSVTSLLSTTMGPVSARYEADWLSVDANTKRVIYTALTENAGENARVAIVHLTSGPHTVTVTVRQESKEPDLSLKVGQSVDDGIGMIFQVDPVDPMIGKAVSVKRMGGSAFEASVMSHNATSAVNGFANTALFTSTSEGDAVAYCKSLGEGWYLPARDELWDLFDTYNGIGHNDPNFVSAVPNSLTETEKTARAAFDQMLTDLQGDVVNAAAGTDNGESYWSSTENAAGDKVSWIRFGKSGTDIGVKTATNRFVRCMRTVGNYIYQEEPATLSATPNSVTLEGANASEALVTLTSNKTLFSVTLADDSWLSYSISGSIVTFKAKSRNSTGGVRTTIATVTAGTGTAAKSVEVTVNQDAATGESSLVLSTSAVTVAPDASGRSEVITMTSDETEFAVTLADDSWVRARIDQGSKTLYFCTLSPRLDTSSRVTTATVTAGTGVNTTTAQVTITQRGLLSSEFAVGQVIADNGSVKGGIVFWVNSNKRSEAKIMSLDRGYFKWSTATTPGATGVNLAGDNGYTNTTALAASPKAAELPAIQYCLDKGTGWYWAARNDMEQIWEAYNGTVLVNISNSTPNAISEFEQACRAAWDVLVTNAGGSKMNAADPADLGDSYWVCRENSAGDKAFYVRFGRPIAWGSANAPKVESRYIRAIRAVSK